MITTRFAPSPTGYLHIGGLRTALLNYLWARKNNGKFLIRIEDTDKSRHNEDAVTGILNAFKWVGLEHDDEIEYQSKRDEIYKKYIDQLLAENRAYKCYMTKEELAELREEQEKRKERPRYDGRYRDFDGTPPEGVEPVIRIKSPQTGFIEFHDGVKGDMKFNVDDILDDFIIARADGSPTYNFVVAVDDALMGVNNVIRGDDHLSNTPKQIVVYEALNFELPKFYHVPMIHNEQGKKLSKRDGATDVMEYQKLGYSPDVLLNFLIRLGWSNGDQEIFTRDEMLNLFDPKNISKSASVYSTDKLNWLSSQFISKLENSQIITELKNYNLNLSDYLSNTSSEELLISLLKERATTFVDLKNSALNILTEPTEYEAKSVKKHFKELNQNLLKEFLSEIQNITEEFNLIAKYDEVIKNILTKNETGMAKLAQPIRIALIGNATSPSVIEVMEVLGKSTVQKRIEKLLATLN
jgi:glutamyl-tRNA synthetase